MTGFRLKILSIVVFAVLAASACVSKTKEQYVLADDKSYDASLFRQNCAICHGPEGEGKTLDTGVVVPSLRAEPHKFKTHDEVFAQISNGGNGMLPFRDQLSAREREMLTDLVIKKLRSSDH